MPANLESIERAIKELKLEPVLMELENPFGLGYITSDGVQYSTEKTTDTASAYRDVEIVTIGKYLPPGRLIRLQVGLTCSLAAASTATADVSYQWMIGNSRDWVGLHTAVLIANINTTNVERTYSGNFGLPDSNGAIPGVTRVPFLMKLRIMSDEANEGQGKTKNSSWVKYWYIPD